MAGLNNIREAYEQVYAQLDERMDPEERALRRAEIADKKASRMDAKVGAKYAGSEAKSAEREDKKSRGKHIHGMADSVELEGELVDEEAPRRIKLHPASPRLMPNAGPAKVHDPKQHKKVKKVDEAKDDSYLETDMNKRQKNNEKAIEAMKKTKAHADMVKAARKHFEEVELTERELDPTETREKERLVKGLKKSAKNFKSRYGERAKSVMHATATKMAKERMDTSKSDRRYGVER